MSVVIIPFSEFPAFTQEIVLDNIPYRFSFNWNTRGEYWSLIITDRDENVLIAGIKLVMYYGLIRRYPGRNLPPGDLIVIDPSEEIQRVGRDDFQDKVYLTYVEESDFASV